MIKRLLCLFFGHKKFDDEKKADIIKIERKIGGNLSC